MVATGQPGILSGRGLSPPPDGARAMVRGFVELPAQSFKRAWGDSIGVPCSLSWKLLLWRYLEINSWYCWWSLKIHRRTKYLHKSRCTRDRSTQRVKYSASNCCIRSTGENGKGRQKRAPEIASDLQVRSERVRQVASNQTLAP